MNLNKPDKESIRKLFRELKEKEGLDPRASAFKQIEIVDFFHKHYMKETEIILAIAGEMQKHFKEK